MKTKFISVALVGLLLATSPSSAFAKVDVSTLSSENDQPENTNIFTEDKAQKLSPLLEKFKEDLKETPVKKEKVVYILEYTSNAPRVKENVLQEIKKLPNTKVLYEYKVLFQGVSIETFPENLDAIKAISGVKTIERSQKIEPLMENVRKMIKVNEASDYLKKIKADSPEIASNYDGRGMLIANIDTGMDYRHKAMRIDDDAKPMMKIKNDRNDPFWVSDKIPHAFNYLNGSKDTVEKYDDLSPYYDPHGQHIGGILAANDTKEDIEAGNGMRGVAPNAQVLAYKMYSYSSDAFAGDETLFHAFEDSILQGADVASISSGFTGTGLVGEKYWYAIRAMRNHGIPVFVATGNYATAASNSSWDRYANNALGMVDTGNVTRTAAHEDAIAVGSSRNTTINFPGVKIGDKKFKYSQIGAFFDKTNFPQKPYKFIYLGKCQDEDIVGKDLKDRIVVMDRIFSTDMKYAFKKVQDKGAKGVIVVNTVSYYNRDDWEVVPAMGYDRDERTSMQVFSISGRDGTELWKMIDPDKGKITASDTSSNASSSDYRIDMKVYNAGKPAIGKENTLNMAFLQETIPYEDQSIPAGSTSWGPRTDLMLKPDLSAPGKNVYSTLNVVNGKHDYVYASGTSMATPVAAASSVIIRPTLKKMVKSEVLENAKIDLVTLTKIVMQNTSGPMIDPSTGSTGETCLFASPRQQGAGLINVERALKTKTIASYQVKDSTGKYNAYGAVSLKEIRGGAKDFTIDLYNTSDKDVTFTVSASPVTTDGEKNITKLDEEYIDETSKQGKQIVAELHPVKVDGAEIVFNKTQIKVPAKGSYSLKGTLKTGAAADRDKFVEGFITFESSDVMTQPSLSMPIMGFAGDWNKEPIIDKWAWEEGSKSGQVVGFDEQGKPKRPGTLNFGRGGEHDVDLFHPAGVIKNTKDGNPKFEQDPELFALNTAMAIGSSSEEPSKSESGLIAGNDDYEINNAGLTPDPLVLRSASDSKIFITDEKGKNLRTMAVQHFVRGILNSRRNTAKGLKESNKKVWGDLKWDGTVFNPHIKTGYGDEIISGLDQLAEGQYYYTFQYRLTPEYDYQTSKIPLRIDNTRPSIESLDLSNPDQIKLTAKDTYHKANDLNQTYFLRDQQAHPSDFHEVASKVWYVGAGFVDEDGEVLKEFKVQKTTKEGDYVIEGANENLAGKTLEIVAIDGAGNYAPTKRVVFEAQLDSNGDLNYVVQDYGLTQKKDPNDPTTSDEYGFIDKAQGKLPGKSLKNVSPKTQTEPTPTPSPYEEKIVTGDPSIAVDTNSEYITELTENDMKKYLQPKELEIPDFTAPDGKKKVMAYGDYSELDSEGLPKYYEYEIDGQRVPVEPDDIKTEEVADLKADGFIGKVVLNQSNGFSITGDVKNVSKNAKVYFQSTGMKKNNQKKAIQTFDYDATSDSVRFDFYGNRNDRSAEGTPFDYNGDITIFVVDRGIKSNVLKLRMPEVKESEEVDPNITVDDYKAYRIGLKNIEEFSSSDLKSKVRETDDGHGSIIYKVKDDLKVNKGYAVRIISYNAGKKSMVPLSDDTYFAEPKTLGNDEYIEQDINFNILQGFNVIRFEIYKPELTSDGAFKRNSAGEIELSENNMVFEKGRSIYFDKDSLQLDMDPDTFNPFVSPSSDKPILYTRTSPMTLRGKIGDKGGFMWHLRINHHIIDEYLIYGDLKSDNSKTFSFTFDVKDGDIMDWGAKDYSGNGMPEKNFDTGVTESLPDKYDIYIDTEKPEVSLTKMAENETTESTYVIPYTGGKLGIDLKDFTNTDKSHVGAIQEKVVMINGKVYTDGMTLDNPTADKPWNIKVKVSDYARNTTVKQFLFNGDEIKVATQATMLVKFNLNGASGHIPDQNIILGEDVLLPSNKAFTAPEGKEFDAWLVNGERYYAGKVLKVGEAFEDLKDPEKLPELIVNATWKEKEVKDKVVISFDLNGGQGSYPNVEIAKGDNYTLPYKSAVIAPEGKVFDAWQVEGQKLTEGEKITVTKNMAVMALWKDKQAEDKPDQGSTSSSSGGGSSSTYQGTSPTSSINSKDYKGHWAEKVIDYNLSKGYFKNISTNEAFAPEKATTRAEFVTVLARLAKVDGSKYDKVTFKDVDKNAYYSPYIAWAKEEKIVYGIGNDLMSPNKTITREEMATILYRFIQVQKIAIKQVEATKKVYTDENLIALWAKDAVGEMSKYSILQGNNTGDFNPKGLFTRAQLAQVVYVLENQ